MKETIAKINKTKSWFFERKTKLINTSQTHPEKAMATHFSTLAWEIPGMEEPGRLQSIGLSRVGHD